MPLLRFVGRSWHVYPLGFLFGLGFDTATEIGLLALSATAAQSSVTVFGILSLRTMPMWSRFWLRTTAAG
jgi:high-affinity nickel-transport protein